MAINFPNSPSTNDTHTEVGKTWKWDGVTWNLQSEGNYNLPIATAGELGGIKVGTGLQINATTGILSTTGGGTGISDGDKGDITVTNSGVTWSIDNDAVDSAEIADGAVDLVHLSATGTASTTTFLRGDNTWASVSAGGGVSDGDYGDISVTNSGATWNIDADTVGLTELSASGTASSTTYLRGDNTWATVSGGGGATYTIEALLSPGIQLLDDGNAGASNRIFFNAGDGMSVTRTSTSPHTIEFEASVALNDLTDVDTTGAENGKIIKHNGTSWVIADDATSSSNTGGTVTSVIAGTGLSGGTITTTGTIALNATLDNLSDVTLGTVSEGKILKYTSGSWSAEDGGGGGISGITIKDETTTLSTDATTIKFAGAGVQASGSGSEKTVTVPGGIQVQNNGANLSTTCFQINFTGGGVTASGTDATKTINIPGGVSDGTYGDIQVSSSGTNFQIKENTISTTELSASGTANSTTYLRGDNTWQTVSGGASSLNDLSDVSTAGEENGKVLKHNGSSWVVASDNSPSNDSFSLSGLSDVQMNGSPTNDQVLTYSTATNKWKNAAAPGGTLTNLTSINDVTAGQGNRDILMWNGSAWVPKVTGFYGMNQSDSSNGSLAVNDKVNAWLVIIIGGGGGAGTALGTASNPAASGGGGGGGAVMWFYSRADFANGSMPTSMTWQCGAKGNNASNSVGSGTNGGQSKFFFGSSTLTAYGGVGSNFAGQGDCGQGGGGGTGIWLSNMRTDSSGGGMTNSLMAGVPGGNGHIDSFGNAIPGKPGFPLSGPGSSGANWGQGASGAGSNNSNWGNPQGNAVKGICTIYEF